MAKLGQKPNGIYYLDVVIPGEDGELKRQRVSCETRDKRHADAQRRDWIAGLHPKHPSQGGVVAPKGRAAVPNTSVSIKSAQSEMTVALWLTKCLSDAKLWGGCSATPTHRSNVRILSDLIGDRPLAAVTSRELIDLENTLRDDHKYAEGSIRKLLSSLSSAYRRAEELEVISSRPKFPTVIVRDFKERVVSLDEERIMFECIEKRRNAEPLSAWWHFEKLCALLLDTGFRKGEAFSSGPSSVKRKRWFDHKGRVTEATWIGLLGGVTKSDKPRDVPCTARVLALIPELNARAAGGKWFPWPQRSSGPQYLMEKIRDDMRERGYQFDDVTFHTFRHTCATRLAESGMDLIGLRDWLGHSDIKITAARYIHLMNGHIYRGASILDAYSSPLEDEGLEEADGTKGDNRNHVSNGNNRDQLGTMGVC